MRFTTVMFDLDGTLTDPGEGIVKSITAALREASLPTPPPVELRLCIGPPLRQSFLDLGAAPDQVEGMIDVYRTRYREVGMFENMVYPEIPELLEAMRSRGCRLFVVTSKPASIAEPILEHFGLRSYFDAVFGARLDGALSDKGDLLNHVENTVEIDPPATAFVGDRKFDMTAARSASYFSVGALWGYGSRRELVAAEADALVARPRGVLDALGASLDSQGES